MFCVSGQKPPQIEFPFRAQVHTVFISIWVNQSEPKPSASAYPRRDSGGQRNKPWNFAAKLELHGRPCGRWFFFREKIRQPHCEQEWWLRLGNYRKQGRTIQIRELCQFARIWCILYIYMHIYMCACHCKTYKLKPSQLPNTCCDHFPPFTSGNQTWQWTI